MTDLNSLGDSLNTKSSNSLRIDPSTEYGVINRNTSMVMSVQKKKKKLERLTNLNSQMISIAKDSEKFNLRDLDEKQ
jgi:hypothetical protein